MTNDTNDDRAERALRAAFAQGAEFSPDPVRLYGGSSAPFGRCHE